MTDHMIDRAIEHASVPAGVPTETLGLAFGLDAPANGDRRVDAADVDRLKEALGTLLAGGLAPQHIPCAATETLKMLRGALGKPIGAILTDAWNQRQEFRKYTDPEKFPPGTTVRATLKPHTITWTYRPSIRVLLDGQPVRKLSFVVEIVFKLVGVEVAVRDARFVRVYTGKSQVTATLRCGEVELARRSSREYRLPGELPLGDGIPIHQLVAPFSFGAPSAATAAGTAGGALPA